MVIWKIRTIEALAALLAVTACGCEPLAELELGTCGNGVLDGGEDCDGYAHPEGTPCAAPGAVNACRYTCQPSCERDQASCADYQGCPVGWGCGMDGICRLPTGTFEERPTNLGIPSGGWFRAADLDADGRDDLAILRLTEVGVAYSTAVRGNVQSVHFPLSPLAYPEVIDVDNDGLPDVVVPVADGLAVLRGTPQAALRPGIYPSFEAPPRSYRFARVDLLPPVLPGANYDGLGDESIALFDGGFLRTSIENLGRIEVEHSGTVEEIVGPLAPGQVDESTFADEVAVAFEGRDFIDLYSFHIDLSGASDPSATASRVTIPAGVIAESFGVRLVQANPPIVAYGGESALCCDDICSSRAPGDDHLDLVVATTTGLKVAYGLGDGRFHSDACTLGNGDPDGLVGASAPFSANLTPGCLPLAVADLDDDGLLDLVAHSGVWLTTLLEPDARLCEAGSSLAAAPFFDWIEAVIGDVNADGAADVIALSQELGDIDVVLSSGGSAMTLMTVPKSTSSARPVVGDFDGDGADDVALLSPPTFVHPYIEELHVLWGEPGSYPRVLQSLGQVPLVEEIGVTSQPPLDSVGVDTLDDLVVATKELTIVGNQVMEDDYTIRFGELFGRQDRQLILPYRPTGPRDPLYEISSEIYVPLSITAGSFGLAQPGDRGIASIAVRLSLVDEVEPALSIMGVGLTSSGTTAAPGGRSAPVLVGEAANIDQGAETRFLMASTNLGESFDTAVVFGFVDGEMGTSVRVSRFVDGSWQLAPKATLSDALPVGAYVTLDDALSFSPAAVSTLIPNDPVRCNLGYPGGEHLLLTMIEDRPGPFIEAGEGIVLDVEKRFAVYVFSPDDLRALREGVGSVAPTVLVASDGGMMGVACIDRDGDGRGEIITMSVRAVLRDSVESSFGGNIGFALRLDAYDYLGAGASAGQELSEPHEIVTLDESVVALPGGFDLQGIPVQGMVSGDFDGDGIQDLVLGAFDTTFILYGRAQNP